MPNYQKAQPFDIVRSIKALQQQVSAANIRTRPVSPWKEVVYVNSWTAVTGDGIVWRQVYDNCIHVAGRAIVPSGFTSGTQIASLDVASTFRTEYHPAAFYSVSSTISGCMVSLGTVANGGGLFVYGALAVGNTLVVNAKIPIDAPVVP